MQRMDLKLQFAMSFTREIPKKLIDLQIKLFRNKNSFFGNTIKQDEEVKAPEVSPGEDMIDALEVILCWGTRQWV